MSGGRSTGKRRVDRFSRLRVDDSIRYRNLTPTLRKQRGGAVPITSILCPCRTPVASRSLVPSSETKATRISWSVATDRSAHLVADKTQRRRVLLTHAANMAKSVALLSGKTAATSIHLEPCKWLLQPLHSYPDFTTA
jgi:hypothetical protein